jgi:WD40-like Beta Propeller Repeat
MARATAAIAAVAFISSCSFSPISHRIKVGEEPFIIFVGEGVDHNTDLFAVPAGGGSVAQLTFTPLIERGPRLSPTGDVVAFLRMRDTLPGAPREVVLMNLLGGGEVTLTLPADAGLAQALSWSRDGRALYVRTDHGDWQAAAPPAAPLVTTVAAADSAVVDSAFDIWLGDPRFARVISCGDGGLCILGPKGDTTSLAPKGHDPIRWGGDSVAWFQDGGLVVRSLGPGRERHVTWTNSPDHPHDGSYTPGPPP